MKNCTMLHQLYNPVQTYSTISDFANVLFTVSYTIAEVSLAILEGVNNNVQRYIKLSTPVDEKMHLSNIVRDSGIVV